MSAELLGAVTKGDIEAARTLLDRGMDVNALLYNDYTALLMASLFDREEMVRLLLERGANVNVTTESGRTPLMWAAYQ